MRYIRTVQLHLLREHTERVKTATAFLVIWAKTAYWDYAVVVDQRW